MNENLAYNLAATAQHYPDRPALRFDHSTISYSELDAATASAAAILRERGVRPGDRVGIMLANVPEFAVAYYGVLRAGGIVVPMNVMLKRREIAFYLSDSEAQLVFVWHQNAEAALAGTAEAGVYCVVVEPETFAP
jgi:long-chain acyl-CoA synthetase